MKRRKRILDWVGIIIPLCAALVCVIAVSLRSNQASLPVPMRQVFIGEYSYDCETWHPVTEKADLNACKGDLFLRGHFEQEMDEGLFVQYYRNHIGVAVKVNRELVYMDAVTEISQMGYGLFDSMCGKEWSGFCMPEITPQDDVEIWLYNPHRAGNETAYRDFLDTLCVNARNSDILEKKLETYGEPFRFVGSLCAIVSLMIMGAAGTAVIVRVPVGGKLLKQGLLTLFAGGYILFDAIDVSFWNELVVLNTYARHLCMMLAILFMGHFFSDALSGRKRKTAKIALGVSSAVTTVMIVVSLAGMMVIYDMMPYWEAMQLILCPALAVFCAMELRLAPKERRLTLVSGLVMSAGVILDIFGVGESLIWQNPCSKILFIVLFVLHVADAARSIVVNHREMLRAQTLEKELENSRISIMLSQIQPHFLYNVLGTIRGLCREDPAQAWRALGDFSDYLRGNMSALSNSRMILFTNELRHIEAYLRLEKMRMGDKLNILYDIQERSFSIPPLTIQPLVENAVKHGLFEKGGGTLSIHTRRENERIVISVRDDGTGFDQLAPLEHDDNHAHVGLINVRSRLEKISGGSMEIDSVPGKGTTVTVILHNDCEGNGGERK